MSWSVLLLVLTQLAVIVCSTSVTAMIKGKATMPCNAPESVTSNHSLTVYWQKKTSPKTEVVLETRDGQAVLQNQTKKYVNRTRQDATKLILYLDQVTVMDEGTYECIVNYRPGEWLDKIHESEIQLNVLASFSSPELRQEPEGKLRNNTMVTLTCNASEGYPVPQGVLWIVSGRNGMKEFKGEVHKTQDNSTRLYNLTSNFTMNFTDSVNVSCTIRQTVPLGPVTSRAISIELEEESHNHTLAITIPVVVVVLVAIGTAVALYVTKCKPCKVFNCCPGPQVPGGNYTAANRENPCSTSAL